ncbi:hypothetical protein [Pseudomonas sp. LS-2]|uniref:hypothetical protein n=1 Tax=Pseudomonas sp. LS-2 TaxID=2315859 RepID=UPI000E769A22|nr:hypothetical protein [Pseudomonas sp. LS-2]RJX81300.1 hypothetical protein D3M70_09150 [Pseudomonas sp. LS-2]
MKSNATRTNTTTYSATVHESEITATLCDLLAKQNGFSLESSNVRCRGYHSAEDTSTGYRHSWKIEVTVDHSQEASHENEA